MMKKLQKKKYLQEIEALREHMNAIYNEKGEITKEVLRISTKLDRRINIFMKLSRGEV